MAGSANCWFLTARKAPAGSRHAPRYSLPGFRRPHVFAAATFCQSSWRNQGFPSHGFPRLILGVLAAPHVSQRDGVVGRARRYFRDSRCLGAIPCRVAVRAHRQVFPTDMNMRDLYAPRPRRRNAHVFQIKFSNFGPAGQPIWATQLARHSSEWVGIETPFYAHFLGCTPGHRAAHENIALRGIR